MKVLNVRFEEHQYQALRWQAFKTGRPMAALVREAAVKALNLDKPVVPPKSLWEEV